MMRFPIVLATNPVWILDAVHRRLQWGGFDPQVFQFITHIQNMTTIKPYPTYYQELLDKIGHKAEDVFLIGNDAIKDGAARRVGIRVALLDRDKPRESFTRIKEVLSL